MIVPIWTLVTPRCSRRDALYVSIVRPQSVILKRFFPLPGFLPVLYAYLSAQYKLRTAKVTPPVHLPTDSDNEDDLLAPPLTENGAEHVIPKELAPESRPMHGWRYLLLWLPAACDLTGTTVSLKYTRTRLFGSVGARFPSPVTGACAPRSFLPCWKVCAFRVTHIFRFNISALSFELRWGRRANTLLSFRGGERACSAP